MKKVIFSLAISALFIIGCTTQNKLPDAKRTEVTGTTSDTVRIANDELEYEIIIIDPGFNSWLASRARPRGYHSQQHLESKNRIWVMEWNSRVLQPRRYGDLYQMQIDYTNTVDYGYEVNYLLYNYLVYFQQTNRQRLGGIVPEF